MNIIKAMRTFLVVTETMNFSEASRRLNLVVSAVSRQVTDLEKYFGCILLYRTTRSMELTPEGVFYQQQFQQILKQLDTLQASVAERQQKIAGPLRITSPQNIGQMGIQKNVAQFLVKHPEVNLSWVMVNRYVNLIEEGFDLAIRAGQPEDSGFIAKKYGSFTLEFVASPAYLENMGHPEHPKELKHHRCLVDSSIARPGRYSYFENNVVHSMSVTAGSSVSQGPLLAEFAATGLGVAQLPGFFVAELIQQGRLVSILDRFRLPEIDIYFIYPAGKLTNPTVRAFIEYLLGSEG